MQQEEEKATQSTVEPGREDPVLLQRCSRQSFTYKGELLKASGPYVKSSYGRNLELRSSTLKTDTVLLELVEYKFISKR